MPSPAFEFVRVLGSKSVRALATIVISHFSIYVAIRFACKMDCGQFHNESAKGNDLNSSDKMQIDPVANGSAGSPEVTQTIGQHDDCSKEEPELELEDHDESEEESEMEIDQPSLNNSDQYSENDDCDLEYDDRAYSEDSCWKAQYLTSVEAKCMGKVPCNNLVRPPHWH
jgi:hypothetical protein